jgi:hypothetical protein
MAEVAKQMTDLTPEELAEVERVEVELNAFINKRAEQAKDAAKEDEQWEQSKRERRDARRRANGWGWVRHYSRLADSHRALALENDSKAERIRGLLGPSLNGHNQTKGEVVHGEE